MLYSETMKWDSDKRGNVIIIDSLAKKKVCLSSTSLKDEFYEVVGASDEDINVGNGYIPTFLENDVLSFFK